MDAASGQQGPQVLPRPVGIAATDTRTERDSLGGVAGPARHYRSAQAGHFRGAQAGPGSGAGHGDTDSGRTNPGASAGRA